MFTKILCATDGSEHADRAVRYATELAREDRSELHVVHVIERLAGSRVSGENVFLNEAEIGDRLKAQTAEIVRENGVSASLHLVKGRTTRVAERLAAIADDLDVDLIVLGTRGHSPSADWCWAASPNACSTSPLAPSWPYRQWTAPGDARCQPSGSAAPRRPERKLTGHVVDRGEGLRACLTSVPTAAESARAA